jgi:hypothetical protein
MAALSIAWSAPLHAGDFRRGQELYENQCKACHESWLHVRENRKVKSLDELRKRIESWADHTGHEWGKREIDDVQYYLNKSYYRFPEEKL